MSSINTSELKVFAYLLINFIVGGLAATGYIDGSTTDTLTKQSTTFVGLVILTLTAGAGIVRILKHPHTTLSATTTQQTAADQSSTTTQQVTVAQPLGDISQDFSQNNMSQPEQQTGLPLSTSNVNNQ